MSDIKDIAEKISEYHAIEMTETELKAAVMLILLIDENNQIDIVLTKRASSLQTYAGHYSFPGGMHDATDKNLYETAQREVHEELNLAPSLYQYLGQLDDFIDRRGHLVRPFVSQMTKEKFTQIFQPAPDEIAAMYYFPLEKLDQIKDDPQLYLITRRHPSYAYTDGNVFVWGLTATILVHFFNIIADIKKDLGKGIE